MAGRDYTKINGGFFTGSTGRLLRGHADAQRVGMYLLCCDLSHPIGLYRLPLATICDEVGIKRAPAEAALSKLEEVGFALYDAASEQVFVVEMAAHQIGPLKPKDNRLKWIIKAWLDMKKSPFFTAFFNRYVADYELPEQDPPKGLGRPFEAPSEALRSPFEGGRKPLENGRPFEAPSEALRSQTANSSSSSRLVGKAPDTGRITSHAHERTCEGPHDAAADEPDPFPVAPSLRVVA